MKRSGLNEKDGQVENVDSAAPASENVDALVSSFLEELAGLVPNMKEAQQLEVIDKKPVDKPPEPETARPVSVQPAEEDHPRPKIDFATIDREIEESLNELEQLKARVIPITERRDPKPDPTVSTPAKPIVNVPAVAPAPPVKARPAKLPEVADAEEQEWKTLEVFRSQIASRKPHPWLKPAIGVAILVIILGIPAYQLFKLRSAPSTPAAGPAASSLGSAEQVADPGPDGSENRVKAESVTKVKPVYPQLARKQGVTGTVVLEADISETGDVVRAKAVSGPNLLREAAEEALMKWKFKPASVDGVNVASKEEILMDFEPPK